MEASEESVKISMPENIESLDKQIESLSHSRKSSDYEEDMSLNSKEESPRSGNNNQNQQSSNLEERMTRRK